MIPQTGYVIEDSEEGRTLVVTDAWSDEAGEVLTRGEADGLVLNYARGFSESNLDFLDGSWKIHRLNILDRGITDLGPLERLRDSLEALSVQAAPSAELDLGALPRLRAVAGEWGLIRASLGHVGDLRKVISWRFDEPDLHAFRDHIGLEQLTIKEAPYLDSLTGLADLPDLRVLGIFLARRLGDISDVSAVTSLRELEFEDCPALDNLDDVEALVNLRFLGFSECGDIESLAPLNSLAQLEVLFAWGSTRVVDGDLSALTRLPRLREIRMRDRRTYRPRVADLVSSLPTREPE